MPMDIDKIDYKTSQEPPTSMQLAITLQYLSTLASATRLIAQVLEKERPQKLGGLVDILRTLEKGSDSLTNQLLGIEPEKSDQ